MKVQSSIALETRKAQELSLVSFHCRRFRAWGRPFAAGAFYPAEPERAQIRAGERRPPPSRDLHDYPRIAVHAHTRPSSSTRRAVA
jgi:hypothetical protein